MAETFKIDVEINAHDNTGGAVSNAQSKLSAFEKSAERTNAQIKKLSGTNANVNINARDRASKIVENIWSKVKQFGSKAWSFTISAVDKASNVLSPITSKIGAFASRAWNATLSLSDRASPILSPITSRLQSVAGRAYNATITAIDRASSVITGVGSKIKSFAGKAWNLTISAVDRATTIISKIGSGIKSVASKAWSFSVSAVDRASTIVSKISSAVKGVAGKAWQITVSVADRATAPIRGIFNMLKSPLVTAGAVLGIGSVAKSTLENGMNFEAGMSKVKAISGASDVDTERLRSEALSQASKTVFTPTETADALSYMGMAGWKAQEMIDGLPAVLNLAAAGGADLATTSDIVTDALTAFNMKASDATHFADVMAAASTNANTNVNLMGETFKYAGSLAGTLGYSIDDVALATGLMANASIKGSQAGTAIRTGLVNLAKPSKDMTEVMNKYGLSLTDAQGNMKSFRTILTDVRKAFKGAANEADEAGDLAKLFGKYGLAGWAAVVNASEEDFNQLASAIDNSNGAAQKMSDTMLDNLKGDITLFKSAWEVAQDKVLASASPILRKGVQSMTDVITKLPEKVEKASKKLNSVVTLFSDVGNLWRVDPEMWNSYLDAGMPTSIGGKLKFAWDELVVNPFSEWWNGTGREKVAGVFNGAGSALGAGLSGGIMALFGLTGDGVAGEGKSLAGSFVSGFKEGFDVSGVIETISNAFHEHPIQSSVLAHFLLSNLTGVDLFAILGRWIGNSLNNRKLRKTIQDAMGKGSNNTTNTPTGSTPGAYSCQTMNVTAGVVNVYGQSGSQPNTGNGGGNGGALPSGNSGGMLPSGNAGGSLPGLNHGGALPGVGSGGGGWALPAAGAGGAALLGGGAAAKAFGAGGGSSLLLGSGGAAETAGVYTADAIIGAGGEVVATGGDLALASSGLSAGAAAGMTAAMVLPVALMTWDQSGLNPKNYTVGKKNEVAWQESGLNPADYGVDPQKTNPMQYMPMEFHDGKYATDETPWYSKAWKGIKNFGSTVKGIGSGIMDWIFPKASAAELDEVGEETGEQAMNAVAKGAENANATGDGKGSKDFGTQLGTNLLNAIGEGIKGMDAESLKDLNIGENLMGVISGNLENMDSALLKDLNIGETLLSAIGENIANMDTDMLADLEIGAKLIEAISSNLGEMDADALSELNIGESLMTAISSSFENIDISTLDIGSKIMEAVNSSLEMVDFTQFNIGSKITEGIGASLEAADISAAIQPIISKLQELNSVKCNPEINATDNATETITAVQALVDTYGSTTAAATLLANDNASGTISAVSGALAALNGQSATVTINIQQNGTIPGGVHFAKGTRNAPGGLSIINDQRGGSNATELVEQGGALMEFAGRDVMVPLAKHAKVYTAQQRERMLSALNYPHYKEGKDNDETPFNVYSEALGDSGEDMPSGGNNSIGNTGINIEVSLQPAIEIKSEGGDETKIVSVLKAHLKDMADEVAGEIANDLIKIFPNIPTKGEAY